MAGIRASISARLMPGGADPEREVDPAPVGQLALDPGDHDGGVRRRGEGVLRQRTERPHVVAHPQRPVQQQADAEHRDDDPQDESPAGDRPDRLLHGWH